MGKMSFGKAEKKQVSVGTLPVTSPQPKIVEKIVEVPVEVEVIKEVVVPQNTEIPAKYDDEAVESLRLDVLKRTNSINDKLASQKAKADKHYRALKAEIDNAAEKHSEEHKNMHQKIFLQKNAVEKLAAAQKLEIEEIEALQGDILTMRKDRAKDLKIHIALGIGLLITTLLHLL